MRHHNKNRKFGLERDQRHALMRMLAQSLIERGKIKTTVAKAKEIRPFVEKLVTKAKNPTLHARKLLISRLHSQSVVKRLVSDIAPKYTTRSGGYTRITKLSATRHDGSAMAVIEFV